MHSNMDYINNLFDDTTDGYIQVMQIKRDKQVKIYNTDRKKLKNILEIIEGETDTFIAPNTMYKPSRKVENIRQFRALYIDIDNVEGDQIGTTYRILELADHGIIPKPSMACDSGRGVHLYWRIKDAPYGALYTWQELEDYLYCKLKPFGADIKATDAARLLRIPNTINSKNNQKCRVLYVDEKLQYNMYDLREKYLHYKTKSQQLEFIQTKKSTSNKVIINNFFNSYSLHMERSMDLLKLCKLRNYDLYHHRNMVLHCFAYWKGIYTRDIEQLTMEVIELNESFDEPLKKAEVRAIMRCIPKAIQKFIAYEQGVRSGENRRATKGMNDKEGYWYKNQTLIDSLNITQNEQKQLKTIIGIEEKYRRNNKKRYDNRRNENGLTSKQQQLKELKEKVIELKEKGLNNTKIAGNLNIDRAKVRRLLKF